MIRQVKNFRRIVKNAKIEMYCVTDKEFQYLNELNYNLGAVGKDIFQTNT